MVFTVVFWVVDTQKCFDTLKKISDTLFFFVLEIFIKNM